MPLLEFCKAIDTRLLKFPPQNKAHNLPQPN